MLIILGRNSNIVCVCVCGLSRGSDSPPPVMSSCLDDSDDLDPCKVIEECAGEQSVLDSFARRLATKSKLPSHHSQLSDSLVQGRASEGTMEVLISDLWRTTLLKNHYTPTVCFVLDSV